MKSTLHDHHYTSFDNENFGYQCWLNSDAPETVIIAVHGINGAACDYTGLGEFLCENLPHSALYAAETRGQGNDPETHRRGDIYHAEEWYRDLLTFTQLIRQNHPSARIIWCGESMGSLIVSHAYHYAQKSSKLPCDALILLAPVVDLSHKIPLWKYYLAQAIAQLIPRYRIKLNILAGDEAVKVTQGSDDHDTQAATNSYYIPSFTLRLLSTLGKHIRGMHKMASHFSQPTLIINGGHDYFTPPSCVETFCSHIPDATSFHHAFYPEAYHLLLYDEQRAAIFQRIIHWIHEEIVATN